MKLNTKKIFLFITIIILATICLQVYWNYKNYLSNKERLFNEVQIAFDNSLESYFDQVSKETFISVLSKDSTVNVDDLFKELRKDTIYRNRLKQEKKAEKAEKNQKLSKNKLTNLSIEFKEVPDELNKRQTKTYFESDSLRFSKKNNSDNALETIEIKRDSTKKKNYINFSKKTIPLEPVDSIYFPSTNQKSKIIVLKGKKALDSIGGAEQFPNKITMSFVNDTIKYQKLDSIFKRELNRKKVVLTYEINHYKKDTLFSTHSKTKEILPFTVNSNSSNLKKNENVVLNYNYTNSFIVKRMSNELILSLLFSLAVIGCLYFLVYIIQKQKKVDEIKNDFINNITHEFKTPITTIATALEGMSTFNPENDLEKNKKYIAMSFNQLHKLENMVEKILETATLNADELQLNLEQVNLVPFIQSIIKKHQDISKKDINFSFEKDEMLINADSFYLENAISNLLDNAIKYGGNKISISIFIKDKFTFIEVKDNGNSIEKSQEKLIFEKFYRIPKGNIHDVKGYGIGLYYAKTIIEKHLGTLGLSTINKTIFTIKLPNEY
jgi:two-component system phosphate regulon sensor histidine kinase PhoR